MVTARAMAAASLAAVFMLSGCSGGSPGNGNRVSTVMPGGRVLSDAQIIRNAENDPKVKAMLPKMPSGTRVLYLSSVTIDDNGTIATFPATARLMTAGKVLSVFDPQSGQTFNFSANSSVSYLPNGTKLYVPPGKPMPSWVAASLISKSEVLK